MSTLHPLLIPIHFSSVKLLGAGLWPWAQSTGLPPSAMHFEVITSCDPAECMLTLRSAIEEPLFNQGSVRQGVGSSRKSRT